jgi:hypothetical protein
LECDSIPDDDSLYDGYKYPMIGRLLEEHPEIDYSDVSYDIIEEKSSKTMMYIFSSSDSKRHAYTIRGEEAKRNIEDDGSESFEFAVNDKCKGKIIYKKDGSLGYSFNSSKDFNFEDFMENMKLNIKHKYSQKEDIEYWIEQGGDEDGYYSKVLDKINKRLQKRKEVDFFDL